MGLSCVGTGRRAALDLLRSLAGFRSDGSKVSVEKIIAALEQANLVEARHLENVFSTGVDKVAAAILETPLGAGGATVTVVEDFARHLLRLAELEAKLRETASGALGNFLGHSDARCAPQQGSVKGTKTGEGAQKVQVGDKRRSMQSTGRGGEAADEVGQSSCWHFADGTAPCSR